MPIDHSESHDSLCRGYYKHLVLVEHCMYCDLIAAARKDERQRMIQRMVRYDEIESNSFCC